ncbi:MAG: HlyD family efflux transporter periplasmic adaptor subunit [Planctomycetes bacterium]|nr:HlyD family efflux transporter periplasmic adaptor subunit [Planctomycetota bacterium]
MKTEQVENQTGSDSGMLGFVVKVLVPGVIVTLAAGFLIYQMKTKPLAPRKPQPSQAKQVRVQVVKRTDVRAVIDNILGPVMSAQEVTLSPQVSGLVVTLSPDVIPGGIVSAGQTLLGIDASDYRLTLQQRQSDVTKAILKLELERGNQIIARQEYEMLGDEVLERDKTLMLREPHLAEAKASLEAAQAAVSRAELDLNRCQILSPFNAVVRSKQVDLGARVSPGSNLVSLAGTDEYWIEAPVRVEALKWIKTPSGQGGTGSRVKIYDPDAWGPGLFREGVVIRLLSDIEEVGLFARLLVSIQDPLALTPENQDKPVLLLGSKVDVEIQGNILESVIKLDREWLRDGTYVWVLAEDNSLKIQEVTTSFRGFEQVCVVEGLEDGDRVVLTDIAAPVEGMPLVLREEATSESNQPGPQEGEGA